MCLIVLLLIFGPRVVLLLTWLFTDLVSRAYDSLVIPVFGLFVAPWTTLAYVVLWSADGLSTIDWIVVAVGLFADLGSYGSSARTRWG